MHDDTITPQMQELIDMLDATAVDNVPIPLHSGQVWCITEYGVQVVHQLMGRLDDTSWSTLQWVQTPRDKAIVVGTTLRLHQGRHDLKGAGGTGIFMDAGFHRPGAECALLTLDAESYLKGGSHASKVLSVRSRDPITNTAPLLASFTAK